MPRKELKTLSKISACSGASGSPSGAGIRSTIASSISSTPIPVLALAKQDVFLFTADQFDDLVRHFFDHRTIHINLIDHGNDLQVIFNGEVKIGDGLCLNAL